MDTYYTRRLVAIALILSFGVTGPSFVTVLASETPEHDLTIDNIPCNFNDNKTLYIDTQTNDRGFVIYNDYLLVRSHYLSFYDLNISDGHSDTNLVSGAYCYATIPAVNATLTDIREVNNIGFSTDSGSVTVSIIKNTRTLIKLRANSSNDAELNIFVYNLVPYDKYKLSVDGDRVEMKKSNGNGSISFEYDGAWSSHTLTISYEGFIYWGDFVVLLLKLGFVLGIAVISAQILLTRRRGSGRG